METLTGGNYTKWTIRDNAGHFMAHIYGKLENAGSDTACRFVWRDNMIVAGIGSRYIGVHVFDETDLEVFPVCSGQRPVEMTDFFPVVEVA